MKLSKKSIITCSTLLTAILLFSFCFYKNGVVTLNNAKICTKENDFADTAGIWSNSDITVQLIGDNQIGKAVASWKKVSKATGYQLQYTTNKKTVQTKKTKYIIKKLKKKNVLCSCPCL